MSSKYRIRRDANQKEIVSFLETNGFAVVDFSTGGLGIPDICVHKKNGSGATVFIELKFNDENRAELKKSQIMFLSSWSGYCGIARDFDEALRLAKYPDEYCLSRKQKDRLAGYCATMTAAKIHLATILKVIE